MIAGGIDQVSEDLLVVLDAATLWITVAKEYEFLLLPGPKPTDTFFVDLQVGKGRVGGQWLMLSGQKMHPAVRGQGLLLNICGHNSVVQSSFRVEPG